MAVRLLLRWTPNCTQASRTHTVIVLVTDTGNPNLRDTRTFSVVTRECVVPELGRLVLEAGDSGRVPVNLISSVPLTSLAMPVETQARRLTNFSAEPIVAEICAATLTPGASHPVGEGEEIYALNLTTCPNQFLIGTQQVAWLHFTAFSNQSSAFVSLVLDNITGQQLDGTEVRNFAPQAGRVVIVGDQPLLEAVGAGNGLVQLILYSRLGRTNDIVVSAQMPGPAWQTNQVVVSTNLFNNLTPFPPVDGQRFFRPTSR